MDLKEDVIISYGSPQKPVACFYVEGSCVHVNARIHRFSKNLEHTSKLKAPEVYVKQVASCAPKILDFPVENVVAAAT